MAWRALVTCIAAWAALLAVPAPAAAATPVRWCGTPGPSTDRPDAVTGRQIQAVYAIPSDGLDRLADVAHVIASDLAETDAWWRREDPTRTPRFDRAAFAGCTSAHGALDISFARLPQPGSFYAPEDSRAERVNEGLRTRFANPFKKYVVYYDGPLAAPVGICGQSPAMFNDGGPDSMAFVYFAAPRECRDRLLDEQRFAVTATHELVHLLGALQPFFPPHACPGDAGHPCDDPRDILHPSSAADLAAVVLDANRDDYYAHAGQWADVQDSLWLERLDAARGRLAVVLAGSGTVVSDLPGIACNATCTTDWQAGTTVELTAAPAPGFRFTGWSGACTGTGACSVTLGGAQTVTATFAQPRRRLTVSVRGSGSVTAPAIACPPRCAATYAHGTRVRLTARPRAGWRLTGWGGACRGTARTCTVTMAAARSVRATFARR